jgi:hypothetical protein
MFSFHEPRGLRLLDTLIFASLRPNKSPYNVVSAFIFTMTTSFVHHLPSLEYATVEPTAFFLVYNKVCLFSEQLAFRLSFLAALYVARCALPLTFIFVFFFARI